MRKIINCVILFLNVTELASVIHNNQTKSRRKRALLFPNSSTIGIFAAIAIPIDLPNRNVFLSYNFEANYNLPYQYADFLPGPLTKFENLAEEGNVRSFSKLNNSESNDYDFDKETNYPKKRSLPAQKLITRKRIYKMLEDKLKVFGYSGKSCLLKIICEVNEIDFHINNGVLGSILHVILSPSTSEDEGISLKYYKAEHDGKNSQCAKYTKRCAEDLIDLISIQIQKNII